MNTTIQSKVRETNKQSTLTELRNDGFVPAVVYGYKTDAVSIAVNERELLKTLQVTGRNGVMKLQVNNEELNVVLNDYQKDPLIDKFTHADFLAINMTEELEISVQVHLVGESIGEKDGGVLQQPNWELDIKVKPSDIPESFEVDISELNIGETLTVADIRKKSKYEILNDDDFGLVTISAPRTAAELEALDEVSEEAEAEPEVIGEKEE